MKKQRQREKEKERARETFSPSRRPALPLSVCSACGTQAERDTAKYCLVCGKVLSEDYQPLDTLRSSYRLQGKSFLVENAETAEEITDLFAINRNPVSEMAWASFVYSMVPFLGILFIPVTFVIGICGVGVSLQHPKAGGKQLSLISMGLSFPILGIQIFFWWLLYIIPELAGRV